MLHNKLYDEFELPCHKGNLNDAFIKLSIENDPNASS